MLSKWSPLLVVFAVSLALRLVAWAYVESVIAAEPGRLYFIAGDAEGYWDLGCDLAAGREYEVYTPPRRVLRTPGVPAIIATSVTIFGESRTAARGVMVVFAALGPVLIYGLGWRIGGTKLGLAAGLIAACSPLAVGLAPTILSDGPFATLLALQLCVAAPLLGLGCDDGENSPSRVRAILLGLSAAFAVLVRPAWLPAIPIVAVALFVFAPAKTTMAKLRRPLLFIASFAVLMAPWVVRNAFVTGHFVPTSLWLGPTLYDSFGDDADGGSNMSFFDEESPLRAEMSEDDVDKWYRDRAWQAVTADPARAARLAVAKQQRFWSAWPRADEVASPLVRWAVAIWTGAVTFLALLGLWRSRGFAFLNSNTTAAAPRTSWAAAGACLVLVLGPLLYFAALHLAFVGSMRYRMPAELPLCVAAAVGLNGFFNRRKHSANTS